MPRHINNPPTQRETILRLLAGEHHKPIRRSILLKRLGVVSGRPYRLQTSDQGNGTNRGYTAGKKAGDICFQGNRNSLQGHSEESQRIRFVVPLEKKSSDFYIHREKRGNCTRRRYGACSGY